MTRIDELKEQVLAELKKEPWASVSSISKKLNTHETYIRHVITGLKKSKDEQILLVCAKREAYAGGGWQLRQALQETIGGNYAKLRWATEQKLSAKIKGGNIGDLDKILKRLVDYCKNCKDEELKKIFKKHLDEGGYWPNGLEKPK